MKFTEEALRAAGVPENDIEFYRTAHISHTDGEGWQRLMQIQFRAVACAPTELGEA